MACCHAQAVHEWCAAAILFFDDTQVVNVLSMVPLLVRHNSVHVTAWECCMPFTACACTCTQLEKYTVLYDYSLMFIGQLAAQGRFARVLHRDVGYQLQQPGVCWAVCQGWRVKITASTGYKPTRL